MGRKNPEIHGPPTKNSEMTKATRPRQMSQSAIALKNCREGEKLVRSFTDIYKTMQMQNSRKNS